MKHNAIHAEYISTVEPVLKDRPTVHKSMVSQDGWSLVTG